MDYEFTLDEYDKPIAEFSSGFESFGRWFSEALGSDEQQIDGLLGIIEQLEQKRINSRQLFTEDAQLTINCDEVEVRAQALDVETDLELPEDTRFYDDESHASCGLPDFKQALLSWQKFVR